MTSPDQYLALVRQAAPLIGNRIALDGKSLPRPGPCEQVLLRKGLRLLERAAAIEPAYGAASLVAAKLEERLGNESRRLYWLKRARTTAPGSASVSIELGGAYSKQGLQSEAVGVLSAAAQLHPDDPGVRCNLGLALLMLGDVDAAITAFERLLVLEPHRPINSRLLRIARAVQAGRHPCPKDEAELRKLA